MPRLIRTFIVWHVFLALLGSTFLFASTDVIPENLISGILLGLFSCIFIGGNILMAWGLATRNILAWKITTSSNWDFGLRRHSFNAPEVREYFGLPQFTDIIIQI